VALLSLRDGLRAVGHVDHHAHAIFTAPPAGLDEFRGLFSHSPDPRQWPHVATTVSYQRAISVLGEHLACEPRETAVYERRRASDPDEYAAGVLRAAGAELLMLDDGYPSPELATSPGELGRLADCPVRAVMRIESRADGDLVHPVGTLATVVERAREDGFAALKTIAAYRGGLDLGTLRPAARKILFAALEANEATGDPLPVQVHTGLGDPDVLLPRARPGYLKPIFERFTETSFVLLHCYPFVREAGWLASAYANVFLDLSLTIPRVARPAAVLAEALELAPISKLLYGSDAVGTPELYLLAAIWWRDALAEVLPALLTSERVQPAARMILSENARGLYRL
jgi:hypothetical protein